MTAQNLMLVTTVNDLSLHGADFAPFYFDQGTDVFGTKVLQIIKTN